MLVGGQPHGTVALMSPEVGPGLGGGYENLCPNPIRDGGGWVGGGRRPRGTVAVMQLAA